MKLNISYPPTGCQKSIDIDDDKKLHIFMEKRMSQEVAADALGDEFKGYIFKIAGGNDKQGFPMKQGVLLNTRTRLLLRPGHTCFRPRKTGQRKRKSVRGCIVGPDLSALHLIVVKKGEQDLPGLTDKYVPRRLGPKRASKIRKLFNLSNQDDVRKYVIRRELPDKEKDGKTIKRKSKAPKIQRLVTPVTLQRKRHIKKLKKQRGERNRAQAAEYAKLIQTRLAERKQSVSKKSTKKETKETPKPKSAPKKETAKKEAPKKETKKETAKPKEQPKKEAPKKDAPKAKAQPKKEEPKKKAEPKKKGKKN